MKQPIINDLEARKLVLKGCIERVTFDYVDSFHEDEYDMYYYYFKGITNLSPDLEARLTDVRVSYKVWYDDSVDVYVCYQYEGSESWDIKYWEEYS